MSAMATSIGRNPSVRAGFFGAIIGATFALGIAFALTTMASPKDGTADIRAVSGPSAVLDVQAALREHLAREYASVSGPSAVLDVQAALREHLAREYASVSGPSAVLDVQAALREHLAREYGAQ
jgi:hypothetical protein